MSLSKFAVLVNLTSKKTAATGSISHLRGGFMTGSVPYR